MTRATAWPIPSAEACVTFAERYDRSMCSTMWSTVAITGSMVRPVRALRSCIVPTSVGSVMATVSRRPLARIGSAR